MHAAFKSKQPGLTPSIALRNAAIVVFILALVIPDPALRILMLAAGALAAIVYIIRKSFRRGRRYGIAVLSIVLLTVGSISASQLLAYRTHTLLLEKLAKYDGATVRRYFFPIPYVHQLSIESGVDDRDLKAILEMPELTDLTELYLESNDLTDKRTTVYLLSLVSSIFSISSSTVI